MTSAIDELKAIASKRYSAEEIKLFMHDTQRREDAGPSGRWSVGALVGYAGGPSMVEIVNAALKRLGEQNGPQE